MEDATTGGHPLHVACAEAPAIAEAVTVFNRAGKHVRDRFDAAMRVPREPREVFVWVVVAEVVKEQERVVFRGVTEPERTPQLDACAFESGL